MKYSILAIVTTLCAIVLHLGAVSATPSPWSANNITKGTDSMLIYATVTKADGTPVKNDGSQLSAFSGGALSGSVDASKGPGGSTLYALQVFGGSASTPVGYQFYDSASGNYYKVSTTSTYTPGGSQGSIVQPIALKLSEPAASQAITPMPKLNTASYNPSSPVTVPLPPVSSSAQLPVTYSVVSGPAVISGGNVCVMGAGTVVLAANQTGSANYAPAHQVTTSFVVNKADQTLTPIPPIPDKDSASDPFTIFPPTASSGLPVKLSVLSGPATISDTTVTPNGTGKVVLAADQPGDANFNPAPRVTTSFAITKGATSKQKTAELTPLPKDSSSENTGSRKSQIITFPPISDRSYDSKSFEITLPKSSSGLPVSVNLNGPAKLDGNKLTLTGTGTISLLATQLGDTNYLPAPVILNSFIVKKAQKISAFEKIKDKTFGDAPFKITPPTSDSGLPVIIAVTAGSASFMSNTVTMTGAGSITLEAIQPGNQIYGEAPHVKISFGVNKGRQKISPFSPIADVSFDKIKYIPLPIPKTTSKLPVIVTVKSGPASIQGDQIILTGKGTVVLAANQPATPDYSAATEITTTFKVK